MKKIIGFANKFYTLWNYETVNNYVTDAYGKHHLSSKTTHYYYVKNVSFSLDKVKELYPGVQIAEGLRGKVRDFSVTNPIEKGLPDNYFWNGKYRGMIIDEILESDFDYCLWYADNGLWAAAKYIKNHEIYHSHFQAIEDAKNAVIAKASTLKVGDVVDLNFKSNAYNGDEGKDSMLYAEYEDIDVVVVDLDYKMVYSKYPYAMAFINGKFRRTKNKTFNVEVVEIVNTNVDGDNKVTQMIKIK